MIANIYEFTATLKSFLLFKSVNSIFYSITLLLLTLYKNDFVTVLVICVFIIKMMF
jgi:hypothetical protein